eukprot:PhM_4_TR1928/c0_g1_i2/m.87872/K08794/CAMK1; calcium/calmodulin-dependent protein kinase I
MISGIPVVDDITDLYVFDPHNDIIGVGVFATVYRAIVLQDIHPSTTPSLPSSSSSSCSLLFHPLHEDDLVALKVIPKGKIMSCDKFIADLKREIEILGPAVVGGCPHEGVVKLYSAVQDRENVYLVLELVQGVELLEHSLLSSSTQSESDCVFIVRQLLETLEFLHSQMHVVHRDIKPENIMVSVSDMRVVLVDFGVARGFDVEGSPFTCTPCGTTHYCAPETLRRIMNESTTTTHAEVTMLDMYGLGVVVYIMLSGTFPFTACRTHDMLVSQIERGVKFPIAKGWGEVSDAAKDFVARLMDPRPERRLTATEALAHEWIVSNISSAYHNVGWDAEVRNRASLQSLCSTLMETESERVVGAVHHQHGVNNNNSNNNSAFALNLPPRALNLR